MIEDRPISQDEDKLPKLSKRYSVGNPYKTVSYDAISPEHWKTITDEISRGIIREYIDKDAVDYSRRHWFYRGLAQVGHPGAIAVSLDEFDRLGPCFANICSYLASVQAIEADRWKEIGARLLAWLDSDEVSNNEYFRLSILSLFSRNAYIDHLAALVSRFQGSDPYVRREIFLAAKTNNATNWL